jgi:thioredoxin-like negative regulator of GroEL
MKTLFGHESELDELAALPQALVCCHSTRSAYSRRTLQVLTELEPEFPAVTFCALDADPESAQPFLATYQVVALPTVIYFRRGQLTELFIGERSKKSWQKILNSVLNAQPPVEAK